MGSEKYVFCHMLVRTLVSAAIPLLPSWATLSFVTFACGVELWYASYTQFEAKVFKIIRIIYLGVLGIMNIAMLVLLTLGKYLSASALAIVGYICIGLILLNIGIELLEILIEVGKWVIDKLS